MSVGKRSDLHNNDGLCCTTSVLLQLVATWQCPWFAYSCETVPAKTLTPCCQHSWYYQDVGHQYSGADIFTVSKESVSHCSVSMRQKHLEKGKFWSSMCIEDGWWWKLKRRITLSTLNCFNEVELSALSVFKTQQWNIDTEDKSQHSIQDLFPFSN